MYEIIKISARYFKKYKTLFFLYALLSTLLGLIGLFIPIISGIFIDKLISSSDYQFVIKYSFVYISIVLLNIIFGFFVNKIYVYLHTKTSYHFNVFVIDYFQKSDIDQTNSFDSTYLTQRINNDCNNILMFSINLIQDLVVNILKLIIPIILIIKINYKLSIIIFIIFISYFSTYNIFKKRLYNINYNFLEAKTEYFNQLNNQLKYIFFIKTHSAKEYFSNLLEISFFNMFNSALRLQKVSYYFSSLDTCIQSLVQIVIFIWVGISVIRKNITIGEFTIITSFFSYIITSCGYFFNISKKIQEVKPSVTRINEILNFNISLDGNLILDNISDIELKELKYSYCNGEREVFRSFNHKFSKGKIYVLLGKNGSGKSSLLNLIIGVYPFNYDGEILINGINQNKINMFKLRKDKISICEQEPLLIEGTIYDNIFLDSNKDKDIGFLIKNLGFDGMEIFSEKNKNNMINENNNNISGGEKQIISILRTLYKNSQIWIFDEPSSALDFEKTKKFIKYLKSNGQDKIILITSHDKLFLDIANEIVYIGD